MIDEQLSLNYTKDKIILARNTWRSFNWWSVDYAEVETFLLFVVKMHLGTCDRMLSQMCSSDLPGKLFRSLRSAEAF